MKNIFAVMLAMMFTVSTGVFAAKHMEGEKGAKAEASKDAKGAKGDAKKDEKAKK